MKKQKLLIAGMLSAFLLLPLGAVITLDRPGYTIQLSDDGTRCLGIKAKKLGLTIAQESDLWLLTWRGEQTQTAAEFLKQPGSRCETIRGKDTLTLRYTSKELHFDLVFKLRDDEFEYEIRDLVNHGKTIVYLEVPGRIDFPLDGMERFVYPMCGGESTGVCLLRPYFEKRSEEDAIYKLTKAPFDGMARLYPKTKIAPAPKGILIRRAGLIPTKESGNFYNEAEKKNLSYSTVAHTMRMSNPAAFELKLLCTTFNPAPALVATRLGGKGYLFQFLSRDQDFMHRRKGAEGIVHETMSALFRRDPALKSKKICLIDYPNMPPMVTGFDPLSLDMLDWRANAEIFEKRFGIKVERITSEKALFAALNDPATGAILNPYAETFPVTSDAAFERGLNLVQDYVKRGGVWWEVGTSCFRSMLVKKYYNKINREKRYPSGGSDFCCVEYDKGSVAVFGIQPVMRFPYDKERIAVPLRYFLEGGPAGAQLKRQWVLWANAKYSKPWNSHPCRVTFRYAKPVEALKAYGDSLEFRSRIEDKMSPELLKKLKSAMLICIWHENVDDNILSFNTVPPASLAHYIGALVSRFDANYPEHLPPSEKWGTLEDLKRMHEIGHQRGHLLMPYTNTTWWCPHENGTPSPSMQQFAGREKEVAQLLTEEGRFNWRQNRGGRSYVCCHYHPHVIEASVKTTRDFAKYGADMLFSDETGSPWQPDFNPLCPLPMTAQEGRISMLWKSAKIMPTSSEEGYDRMFEFNTLICGGGWHTFPGTMFGSQRFVNAFRRNEWQYWPSMIYLGHDRTLFTIHDLLIGFKTYEALSLALPIGFKMKDVCIYTSPREEIIWCYYLDAIQKCVAKEYEGQKLLQFFYPMEKSAQPWANELVYSEFANGVQIVSNQGKSTVKLDGVDLPFPAPVKAWLKGVTLPPYGYFAMTKNGQCGYLETAEGRVAFALAFENGAYRFAMANYGSAKSLTLPAAASWQAGTFKLAKHTLTVQKEGDLVTLTLPVTGTAEKPGWSFSNYDPDAVVKTEPVTVIANGTLNQATRRFRVTRQGKGQDADVRLTGKPQQTLTFDLTLQLDRLPQKDNVPLLLRKGCNSALSVTREGNAIFTFWHKDGKTNRPCHVLSKRRLKAGETCRITVTVEVAPDDQSTKLRLYLDGKLEASLDTPLPPVRYGNVLEIAPSAAEPLPGKILTLKVADHVLTVKPDPAKPIVLIKDGALAPADGRYKITKLGKGQSAIVQLAGKPLKSVTVEALLQLDARPAKGTVTLCRRPGCHSSLSVTQHGNVAFVFWHKDGKNYRSCQILSKRRLNAGEKVRIMATVEVAPDGQSTKLRLYVDGKLEGALDTPLPPHPYGNRWDIAPEDGGSLSGKILELKIAGCAH